MSLSEKSRPSSRAVINSLFHLPIDSPPELCPHERPGSFSPFHPHPRRIISGRGTYYGKNLLLPFLFLSLSPLLLYSPPRLRLSNSDASICETLFVKTTVISLWYALFRILSLDSRSAARPSKEENPLLRLTIYLLSSNINLFQYYHTEIHVHI